MLSTQKNCRLKWFSVYCADTKRVWVPDAQRWALPEDFFNELANNIIFFCQIKLGPISHVINCYQVSELLLQLRQEQQFVWSRRTGEWCLVALWTFVHWLRCQHLNSAGFPTELVENWQMFGQGDSLEMHFQQNPVALLCVVTSMKLDEFITGSELFILLLHFCQFPLRNAAFYDINFD